MPLSYYSDEIHYEQPKKCKGCVYGRWEGTKQVCMLPKCWNEKNAANIYTTMQASMQIQTPIAQPIMREKTSVPIYDGKKTVMVSVYKDELERQFKKSRGLDINQNIMKSSLR